jgi:hypothetical protein
LQTAKQHCSDGNHRRMAIFGQPYRFFMRLDRPCQFDS